MTTPATPRPRTPRRSLLTAGLSVLLLGGALAGATAVFSGRAQNTTDQFTQQLQSAAAASGVASVEQTSYRKGLTTSTQTMTLTLRADATETPVKLLVTNTIHHGPLPGLKGVGQASVDTDIRFADAKLQAEVDKAFGGRKPQIHTLIGLNGSTDTTINIPDGKVTEADSTVNWKALTGDIHVGGGETTTNLTWPGLTANSADTQAELRGLSLTGKSRSTPQDPLGVGGSAFTVEQLNISSEGTTMGMKGLRVTSENKLNGTAHYDALIRYDINEFKMADQTLQQLQLHLGVRHLAREPLSRIVKLLNEASKTTTAKTTESGLPDFTEAQQKQLQQDVTALLRGQPQITLDRLSVRQPSGDIVLTGSASLPDADAASSLKPEMLLAMPQMLLTMLDVKLDAKGSEKAVQELLALGGAQGQEMAGSLSDLTDAGILKRSGDQLSVNFALQGGQPLLNGEPMGE